MTKYFLAITFALAFISVILLTSFEDTRQVKGSSSTRKNFTDTTRLAQLSQGLHGYISMSLPKQKEGFGYGISFYVSAWPLLDKPLSDFQIGLPGTWIVPDNRGFEEPLCPIGTLARDNWAKRGPSYRDVFQTIEGGVGFWSSAKFPSVTPKFHMNATANCYNQMVSSPGWGPGETKALKAGDMGLVQLSNHLLLPPDGFNFARGTSGEIMGRAWMALYLIPARPKTANQIPTGDLSWTCFINSSNFKGPVAFYIPAFWSKIAFNYPTAEGRGLDVREGVIGSGAIEINTVPRFEAVDSKGIHYTKIPRLQFPVNDDGITTLMQDVTLYSKNALYQPLKTVFQAGKITSGKFPEDASYTPECYTRPTRYDQGPNAMQVKGIDSVVHTIMLGKSSYGLKWTKASNMGYFPEYFKQEGNTMVAISPGDVPPETHLKEQSFAPAKTGNAYTSPVDQKGNVWSSPGPRAGPYKTKLNDGSIVTYYWYKFIDQPALQSLNLSKKEKEELQKKVVSIHANWTLHKEYMPPPTRGKLATIDNAVIVNPPKRLETGYVPIVTNQQADE